jgi:hypothetical protein
MKRGLKYIKIHGRVKSRGEYGMDHPEYRPYQSVTIVDSDGDETHFLALSFPKRLDDILEFGQIMDFYILRYRVKQKVMGIIYAVEIDGKKIFYRDAAIPALKSFALSVRFRCRYILSNPGWIFAVFLGGGFFALPLWAWLGRNKVDYNGTISIAICMGLPTLYILSPIIFQRRGAAISKMLKSLKAEGFNTKVVKTKY